MHIIHLIISTIVLFNLGIMTGLVPFFVSTGEAHFSSLLVVVAILLVAIWCVWYFAPRNRAGTRRVSIAIFAVLFPFLIAWGTYYGSNSDQRKIEQNAGLKEQTYTVSIDYNQPFSSLFKRDTYDDGFTETDSRDNITPENFPVKGTGKVEVKLTIIKFAEQMSHDDIENEIHKRGLKVARIEHLMALHDLRPDLYLFNSGIIYALGSRWIDEQGRHRAAALATRQPHELRAGYSTIGHSDDWFAAINEK